MVFVFLNLDHSVLENYSISETFKLLLYPENNIMSDFSPEEYRISRRRIIESILATDMAFHQKYLSNLKVKIESCQIKNGKNIEKLINAENVNKMFENKGAVGKHIL